MENLVKQIKVNNCLSEMMKADMKLYEKILDTNGFAFHFSELVKLAYK